MNTNTDKNNIVDDINLIKAAVLESPKLTPLEAAKENPDLSSSIVNLGIKLQIYPEKSNNMVEYLVAIVRGYERYKRTSNTAHVSQSSFGGRGGRGSFGGRGGRSDFGGRGGRSDFGGRGGRGDFGGRG